MLSLLVDNIHQVTTSYLHNTPHLHAARNKWKFDENTWWYIILTNLEGIKHFATPGLLRKLSVQMQAF